MSDAGRAVQEGVRLLQSLAQLDDPPQVLRCRRILRLLSSGQVLSTTG